MTKNHVNPEDGIDLRRKNEDVETAGVSTYKGLELIERDNPMWDDLYPAIVGTSAGR